MIRFAAIIVVMLACASPALAQPACKGLAEVNSVDLTVSPDKLRAFVPVKINDVEKLFLLDTGGFGTQIWPNVAETMKLPTSDSNIKLMDLYGHAVAKVAHVHTFTLGRLQAHDDELMLSTVNGAPDDRVAGILGPDYMGRYDTELDIAGAKFNYFSPDHCEGKVIYWQTSALAIVPMTFQQDHHIIITVTLDGHPLRAIIDTGAFETIIEDAAARRLFNLGADNTKDVIRTVGGKPAFTHTFGTLGFEGVAVGNPRVTVFPTLVGSRDPNNGYVTGTRVQRADDQAPGHPEMIIGMNILSKLRLYFAFDERRMYVTPASATPAAPAH